MARFPRAFAERNKVALAVIGLLTLGIVFFGALNMSSLPIIGGGKVYQAVFAEGSGLKSGDQVRVAGVRVGKVTSVKLRDGHVLVSFRAKGVTLRDQTSAQIKVKTMLGNKFLMVDPLGTKPLDGPIPLEHTTTPYDVNAAVSDFADHLGSIDDKKLEDAFNAVADAFKNTPASVRTMVKGLTDLSRTISTRNDALAGLFKATEGVTGTMAGRNAELAKLINDGSDLLGELQRRRDAVHALFTGTAKLGTELHGIVDDNDKTLAPALAKLDRVTAILNHNQKNLNKALSLLGPYYKVLGSATGQGRWVDAYLCGLFDKDRNPILDSDALRNCYPPKGER